MAESKKLRLGLDIGTNSIGWALVRLSTEGNPIGIENMGVRIFSDGRNPKDKTSLAVARRAARQMRRQRFRKKQRQKRILNALIRMGLFPSLKGQQESLKNKNVLEIRSNAVKGRQLEAFELGRAILHLSKSRGFKSGRKDTSDKSDTKLTAAITALNEKLIQHSVLSYGDFLFQRMQSGLSTAATILAGFYPSRAMIEHEFDLMIEKQKGFYTNISNENWAQLRNHIFHQRPLRPVEVGKCSLYLEQTRTFQFMPSFELYRLLCELHNLRWFDSNFKEQFLSVAQINTCVEKLGLKKEIKYSEIRKAANLDIEMKFSIETAASREKIKGCPSAYFFGEVKKGVINGQWQKLTLKQRDRIAESYFLASDEEFVAQINSLDFLDESLKQKLIMTEVPNYSDATCAFSIQALQEIVGHALTDGESPLLVVDKLRKEETMEKQVGLLDYYGKAIPGSVVPIPSHILKYNQALNVNERMYGKIANPTVHIGLNQLRILVNQIIKTYGKPENIHIEFARDLKLSRDKKIEISKKQKANRAINDKVKEFISERRQEDTPFNRERVKLWFEMENRLECCCIYSGRKISQAMVLSEAVEVDHILPFSRSLDDGINNKVLVLAEENRKKGNKTPFEAFGNSQDWPDILIRAKGLPEGKKWRFSENSMNSFLKQNDFLARQLTDTSYLSKIAKKYLGTVLPPNNIVASPGRLTALIRGKLGMNKLLSHDGTKNREDHRHHAIDALVISLVDRKLLKQMARASEELRQRIIVEEPWAAFHSEAKAKVDQIIVAHRVDHGINNAFLAQTAFGLRRQTSDHQKANNYSLVTTKFLDAIKDPTAIVSEELRSEATKNGVNHLSQIGVKKLRVFEKCNEEFEQIGGPKSYIAKITHGKNCEHHACYVKEGIESLTIWRVPLPKGQLTKKGEDFKYEFVFNYYFDAMRAYASKAKNSSKPHPAAKLIMTLHNGDSVAIEADGAIGYYQLITIGKASSRAGFVPLNETQGQQSPNFFYKSINGFRALKIRKIHINSIGKILDGGPVL